MPRGAEGSGARLGATRWEMIRGAVFPHSRSGVVAAVMIGFGRAMGETIAVALVIGSSPQLTENLFGPGDTLASIIANQFGESSGIHRSALIGLGVVLLRHHDHRRHDRPARSSRRARPATRGVD